MLLYHGSRTYFEKFDYKYIGSTNGTGEGIGFYFTSDVDFAKSYCNGDGYLVTVEFKGVKPLSLNKKTLTRAQVKKLIIELGDIYLSNWGDVEGDGFMNVVNNATNSEYDSSDNDVDLISGILHACGAYEIGYNLLYKLYGYDCIINLERDIYVATVYNAFEFLGIEKVR